MPIGAPASATNQRQPLPAVNENPSRQESGAARPPLFSNKSPLLDFIIADPQEESTVPAQDVSPTQPPSPPATAQALAAGVPHADAKKPKAPPTAPTSRIGVPLKKLLQDFDAATVAAHQAFQRDDPDAVRHAAAHIATQANRFGLRALGRIARCVEDAAKAGDRDALSNLLPELEIFVERNRIAMRDH